MEGEPWTSWMDPGVLFRAGASLTPVGAMVSLLSAAGRRLAGHRLTVPGSGGELSMLVESVSLRPDPVGIALGRFDDLRLVASDVRWRDLTCHRLVLGCRTVQVHAFPTPVAIAAPVTLDLAVSPEVLGRRLLGRRGHPELHLDVVDAGRARLRWSRRPNWAALALAAEVSGAALLVRPRTVHLAGRRIRLPEWTPARRIALPDLPRGLRLREVTVGVDEVVLRLVADEWREDLAATRIDRLLAGLV